MYIYLHSCSQAEAEYIPIPGVMQVHTLWQVNELIVGSADGELAVFKGDQSSKPWRRASGLGMVGVRSSCL